jgi:hypothetical protein
VRHLRLVKSADVARCADYSLFESLGHSVGAGIDFVSRQSQVVNMRVVKSQGILNKRRITALSHGGYNIVNGTLHLSIVGGVSLNEGVPR